MKDWEQDQIWNWLIAAAGNNSKNNVRYYIDIKNEILFCLEKVGTHLKPVEPGSPQFTDRSKRYSNYIKDCIYRIKHADDSIMEVPPIGDNFPMLEDPNAHIFSNKEKDIKKMNDIYRRVVY